jgi:protein-tyrosine phosphatase
MDFDQIVEGLFVGSDPVRAGVDPYAEGADVVVCLTQSALKAPQDRVLVHWPFPDGTIPDTAVLRTLAQFISGCLDAGKSVYVHCSLGRNRSALIAACVLIDRGASGAEAVATVRAQRSGALSEIFAGWLESEFLPGTR